MKAPSIQNSRAKMLNRTSHHTKGRIETRTQPLSSPSQANPNSARTTTTTPPQQVPAGPFFPEGFLFFGPPGKRKRKKRKKNLPKSGRRLPPHLARCLLRRIHVHVEAPENLDIFSSSPLLLAATSSVLKCQLLEAFGRTSHISYVSMDPDVDIGLFSVCVSPEEHKTWHCPENDFRKYFHILGCLVCQ